MKQQKGVRGGHSLCVPSLGHSCSPSPPRPAQHPSGGWRPSPAHRTLRAPGHWDPVASQTRCGASALPGGVLAAGWSRGQAANLESPAATLSLRVAPAQDEELGRYLTQDPAIPEQEQLDLWTGASKFLGFRVCLIHMHK